MKGPKFRKKDKKNIQKLFFLIAIIFFISKLIKIPIVYILIPFFLLLFILINKKKIKRKIKNIKNKLRIRLKLRTKYTI